METEVPNLAPAPADALPEVKKRPAANTRGNKVSKKPAANQRLDEPEGHEGSQDDPEGSEDDPEGSQHAVAAAVVDKASI
jgi:hypothetical protein